MRAFLAIFGVVLLSFLMQQWVAAARDLDRGAQHQGGPQADLRPTLDLSRSPLTAEPLATIRAGLTATALVAQATPAATPTASLARPEVPHAGVPFSESDNLHLIWIGLVCCFLGALLIRFSARS